ncbi:hypothetical protein Zmor_024359 [Zophobas morio]|uniref:Uncharacterized protein n=1 Tax=Zophobas morio TaxID=2755281 RepID=A0AA38I0R2_9CUCU|nr:hypothetical protein Zmor_024359 [Zophobas morio]
MYGLKPSSKLLDSVYRKYDYCELFRILLHIADIEEPQLNCWPWSFIQVNFDLGQRPLSTYTDDDIQCLLNYFANTKLISKLVKKIELSDETLEKLKNHPRLPSLTEMARDTFRSYFISTFQITTTKMLSLVNALPISRTHKKIITFETKLYHHE